MRRNFLYPAIIVLGAMILGGCNSAETKVSEFTKPDKKASPQQAVQGDEARRITLAEAKDLYEKGQAYVIDVRNQASYDQGHVRGARLIPAAEILNHISELPRNKTIITYCS